MSPYPNPPVSDIRRRSKRRYVIVGCLCVTGLVFVGSLVIIRPYLADRPVGPDVEQVARDPILGVELDGVDPEEIHTQQGHEPGPFSTGADGITEASREWTVTSGGSERPVADALDEAVSQGAAFWGLRCSPSFVTYIGTKGVMIDGDPEVMLIEVQLMVDPARRLEIALSTDAEEWEKRALSTDDEYEHGRLTLDNAPAWIDTPLSEDCPPVHADLFERVRAG